MSLAASALAETPIGGQPTMAAAAKKAPRTRLIVAKPDDATAPEAR